MVTVPFAAAPNPTTRTVEEMNEPTIIMLFPKRVILTLKDYTRIIFEPGPREVPVSLVDHPYLAACGATKYAPPAKKMELHPRFPELARDLWEAGELLNFAAYIGDGKALSSGFETERQAKEKEIAERVKTHGSESYAEMQARVERDRVIRPEPSAPDPIAVFVDSEVKQEQEEVKTIENPPAPQVEAKPKARGK